MKMNALLAKIEVTQASFNKMIAEYGLFFARNRGAFKGIKKTFTPRDGYMEDARYMGNTQVVTTVDEKLQWFEQNAAPFLGQLFQIEATNSLGAKTVELVVEGISFGKLTALDLMRLKTLLTKKEWETMYSEIPVREDDEVWIPTTNAEYTGREICETALVEGITRTTESEEVILKDPNLDPTKLPANYNAKVTTKKKTVETGNYSMQKFTGEWTHRQRAELLRRRSQILVAVIEALKVVNDTEVVEPNLNVCKFLNFLHYGKK